jgi:death on curing protein
VSDPAPGTEYLSLEDLLDLVNALGAGPVRDLGLLDSACHRPRASFFGQEAYPTLAGKAAALMHSLAGNHALVDGNKRLALLATVVFLRINGYVLDLTDDEAFALTMSVVAGQLDADGICKQLRLAQAPPVTRPVPAFLRPWGSTLLLHIVRQLQHVCPRLDRRSALR